MSDTQVGNNGYQTDFRERFDVLYATMVNNTYSENVTFFEDEILVPGLVTLLRKVLVSYGITDKTQQTEAVAAAYETLKHIARESYAARILGPKGRERTYAFESATADVESLIGITLSSDLYDKHSPVIEQHSVAGILRRDLDLAEDNMVLSDSGRIELMPQRSSDASY